MTDTIHIAFTESAGGCLRAAFRDIPDQRVAALADDLSLGPINPYQYPDRQVFFETLYADTEYEFWYQDALPHIRAFWDETRPGDARRIVWFTRRSAIEYSGFLEFLSREPDPCAIEVVDLTEGVDVVWEDEPDEAPDRVIPISLGELAPEWLRDQTDRARPLTQDEAAFYLRTWDRLKDDEDGVRTLWRGQLYPTIPSTLGEDVLYAVPEDWTSAAMVIGEALGASSDEYHQCGDAFLYTRLLFLIRCGEVEAEGDPTSMRTLQVRRADVVDEDDLFPIIP
ncbi:DUF1835 domain-containing protein [Methanofollis formosanus]|uniref:DUF1835 domain-containing protein n=1 Tax=Methanofollis formosanus TaxID=299308 RepID=A0A8G1EGW0_9EURY|nr:DUF3658 domain-containing protein [Methanofollis formosanus]QYZ79589.1 DUF1835 domain-containing protein [Methanofollis formosanus]